MLPKLSESQRLKLIERVILKRESVSQVCRENAISRVIFYRWLKRYKKEGTVAPKKKISLLRGRDRKRNDERIKDKKQLFNLSPQKRLEMIERVLQDNQPVALVCLDFHISRPCFYKWLKRYQEAPAGKKIDSLQDKTSLIKRYYRQTPAKFEEAVLSVVAQYPELGVTRIVSLLPKIGAQPIVGYHGVQKILERNRLNTFEKRLLYRQAQITPIVNLVGNLEALFARFFTLPVRTRKSAVRVIAGTFFSCFLTIIILGVSGYWGTIFFRAQGISRLGLIFTSLALAAGSLFFLYSMKYYFTLALVLSFSRERGTEEKENEDKEKADNWLSRLLSLGQKTNGFSQNIEEIDLERHPFVSIHLPLYNERRVAKRLLKACAGMKYPSTRDARSGQAQANFEIIVCDDSTDKTTEIVQSYADKHNKRHSNGPLIKILHRQTREGFKGGALGYALKEMNPKTEFVVVFDADFVPYPDSLEMFLKYFKTNNHGSENYRKSKIAVVGGYQWHVLNKSENWITRGVRSEYAGSYVIERPGGEILGLLKQISGSVYMIRADVLKKIGWGKSITEDFELTLKLYEQGYKVVYTPYIQAPAECVSTLKRLIRQRMRWAEGHSHNIKKMAVKLLFSPNLTLLEKMELLYLSPYYLQAFFFMVGTFCWILAETVFRTRLPFWTSLWGWSLVLTNMLALPLMNAVGLFLEESEERDYLGLLAFSVLSYVLVPFQAYAAVKGFLEKEEGTWFRTPKTGRITDIFTRGKFYRWIRGIIPGWQPAWSGHLNQRLTPAWIPADNPYLALSTANNQFASFTIKPRRRRWAGRAVLSLFLILSVSILSLSQEIQLAYATETWPSLYAHASTTYCGGVNYDMNTTIGSSGSSYAFNTVGQELCWFSPTLPTGENDGNTGAGPWIFEFNGAWTGGTTGDSLTIGAQIALVDSTTCGSASAEDSASVLYNKNSSFPYNYSISLTNLANTAITASSPKRIRICLEVTAKVKSGAIRFDYDSSANDSNLAPSTLTVPEKLVYLLLIAPFIPLIIFWMRERKERLVFSHQT